MRRSTQRSTRTMIVLLLLQLTLAGSWTSHALLPFSGPAPAHVEAAGAADCPVVHDADHCLICQAMNLRLLGASVVRLEVGVTVARGGLAAAAPHTLPQPPSTTRQPRAPPVTAA